MICVLNDELNTLQTAKQTAYCTNCLFVSNRQQLSTLLYLPLASRCCLAGAWLVAAVAIAASNGRELRNTDTSLQARIRIRLGYGRDTYPRHVRVT